ELLKDGKSVKRKRTTERHLHAAKRICVATALLGLTGAALMTLLRESSRETSNASYRVSKDPLANKEYREGVHCYQRDNKEGLEKALDHFKHAIALDPKFAMAYNGIFEVYIGGIFLGLSPAEREVRLRKAAQTLMAADPYLAEAHAAQA